MDVDKEFGFMKNKCPTGTTTHIFMTGKVKDGRLDRTNIEVKENPRNKTDHVSYNPPMSSNPQQKVYDQMITAPRYCGNIESSVSWMPHDSKAYFNKMQERAAQRNSVRAQTHDSRGVPASQRSQLPESRRSDVSIPGLVSKTLMNRSSMKNNIITGEPNVYSGSVN